MRLPRQHRRSSPLRSSAIGLRTAPRGIALIIVMISIFVLSILAGGFAYSMKVETRLARNANNEVELEWMGRSAVEYCRWVLAQQLQIPQEPYDTLNQVWAGGSGGIGTSNSPLANVQNPLSFRSGTASWKIIDLERKININTANEALLQQALIALGVDASEMTPIVNSILDWIDRDEKTHIEGAESDYYQGLEPPYNSKNGPIDDLSELLFVKGITKELYWGGSAGDHMGSKYTPRANRFGGPAESVGYPVGLAQVFTPLSRGQVNIYTASPEVLQVILNGDAMAAQKIVELRSATDPMGGQMPMGAPMGNPVPSVNELLLSSGLPQPLVQQCARFFTPRSYTFEVTVDAEMNGYKRQFVAILGRTNPKDIQILSFHWN